MLGSPALGTRTCAAAAVTFAALAALAGPAEAKRHVARPDLVELSVSSPSPASVKAGESFTVSDVAKNMGRKAAPKSVTTLCLVGKPDVRTCGVADGSRNVPALKRGKQSQAATQLKTSQDLANGTFWVVACSDGRAKLKESNETNNCKLSEGKISVVGGDPPAEHGSPGLQGSGTFSFEASGTTMDFSVSFNQAVSGFEIWVPRDQVYDPAVTSRSDTTCIGGSAGPYNGTKYATVTCEPDGAPFAANERVTGTIDTGPPAGAGMGGLLYAHVDDPSRPGEPKTTGPFQISGP